MSDETKVKLAYIALAAVFLIGGGVLIHANERDRAALRQAACANPESAACVMAVRQ